MAYKYQVLMQKIDNSCKLVYSKKASSLFYKLLVVFAKFSLNFFGNSIKTSNFLPYNKVIDLQSKYMIMNIFSIGYMINNICIIISSTLTRL